MENQIEEFEQKLKEKLQAVIFVVDDENMANLLEPFRKLIEISSLEKLQCDDKAHSSIVNQLLKEKPEFTLYDISFLLNTITRVSPKDLEVTAVEYTKILFYSTDTAKEWNKIVAPIQKKLKVDFNNRMALEAKNAKNRPPLIRA